MHRNDRNSSTTLPDIVGEQSSKSNIMFSIVRPSVLFSKDLRQGPNRSSVSSTISSTKKANDNGLCVLGYDNVKSAPIHAKVRQELDYLDREVTTIISRCFSVERN